MRVFSKLNDWLRYVFWTYCPVKCCYCGTWFLLGDRWMTDDSWAACSAACRYQASPCRCGNTGKSKSGGCPCGYCLGRSSSIFRAGS